MGHRLVLVWLTALLAMPALDGCARTGTYVHPSYDFSLVKKIAVMPLENLSPDQMAGEKVRKVVIAELLSAGVVDVVEPGQVNRVLNDQGIQTITAVSSADLKRLGTALGVQSFIVGSVDVYETVNFGGVPFAQVTLSFRALDASTGSIVWSKQQTGGGVGIVGRLFGFGAASMSEATQKAVRTAFATLFH